MVLEVKKNPNQKLKKYLIFRLGENYYGLTLNEVKEVVEFNQCTPLPSSPSYMLGVINLRGKVISAIDLKKKINTVDSGQVVKRPVLIIVEINHITVGAVVDSVSEVLAIEDELIERSYEFNSNSSGPSIYEGIARFKDRPMILIFNFHNTFDIGEVVTLKEEALAA